MAHIAHDPDARPDMRTTHDLRVVLPRTAEVRGDRLFIGGVDVVELAQTRGTALYVMDEAHIRGQLRSLISALRSRYERSEVAYAGKAFTSKAMVALVGEEGGCLDVSSGGELAIARAAGFSMKRVVVHGNNKTLLELVEAIDAGVGRIVVDCFEELERISALATERASTQAILLRIAPGIVADTHEYLQTGGEDSKFGFGIASGAALDAIRRALDAPGVVLKGLHCHIGSQIFALDSFAKAIEVMADLIASVRTETGFITEDLDLGGGLGIAYQAADKPSDVEQFAEVITSAVKREFGARDLPLPLVTVEPGRSIVANAGVTLYTVGAVKEIPGIRTYIAVDGGMTDNIRTALYDARYESILANKADQPRSTLVTIAGKHCESGDVILIDTPLQPAEPGDTLCVFTTGAYNQSMASNYNRQVRPGVVFVKDGIVREVLRRETYDDLMRCEV